MNRKDNYKQKREKILLEIREWLQTNDLQGNLHKSWLILWKLRRKVLFLGKFKSTDLRNVKAE